jgi:inward rectifier potassium channel
MKVPKTRKDNRWHTFFKRSLPKNRVYLKVVNGVIAVQGLGNWYDYWREPYHLMLTLPWSGFILITTLLYLGLNLGFAGLYMLGGDCIVNGTGSFEDAFFFSVQTIASIGYGVLSPKTTYANIIVVVESIAGLFMLALLTGISFARFSRPTAKVMFSKFAVILPINNIPTLVFRTANQRRNQILEAQVTVYFSQDEITQEGKHMRRFYKLALLRSHTPSFFLPWTLMHLIDEHSPLHNFSVESLAASQAQIIVSLSGMDETVSQSIHSRHTYGVDNIILNHQLVDIIHTTEDGDRYIDFSRFHHVEPH